MEITDCVEYIHGVSFTSCSLLLLLLCTPSTPFLLFVACSMFVLFCVPMEYTFFCCNLSDSHCLCVLLYTNLHTMNC